MARHGSPRPKPLLLLIVVLLGVSLFPARWLMPWSGRVAELAGLPLVPLGDGLTAVRVWLEAGSTREDTRTVEVLEKEVAILRRELNASQAQLRSLRDEISRLRRFPVEETQDSVPPRLVSASVVAVDPSRRDGLFRINKGSQFGVRAGGVALDGQDVIVGHVLDDLGRTTATIRPMHSAASRSIKAVISDPRSSDGSVQPPSTPILLHPDGSGWDATIPESIPVSEGAEVRLFDENWPRWAQGCLLGLVGETARSDENPRWNEIRVLPSVSVRRLHSLLIVSEGSPADAGGAP